MKTINQSLFFALSLMLLMSCGNRTGSNGSDLTAKKAKLEELKKQKENIDQSIADLEKEIAAIDTSFSVQTPKLVALQPLEPEDFKHFLTLQGEVNALNVSYITPAGQPGQIKSILVKEGDRVRKGQLVLRLDNSITSENANAARQQVNAVKSQLALAKSVYERQKNLWENNIGTEVQLMQSKTNMEALQSQLSTAEANAKAAENMSNQSNVYSDVNGVVDEVTAKVGETFNGNPLTGGYIRIVGDRDMKVTVTVPESNASKVQKGSSVIVEFPDTKQSFQGTISFLSSTIGATTRGFTAEVKIPSNVSVRPNQIAIIRIMDYHAPQAISVPLNVVQNDEKGKYVLVAVQENGHLIAHKKPVETGQFNEDHIEIKSGLQKGDMIITEGYQNIFDGQLLETNQ